MASDAGAGASMRPGFAMLISGKGGAESPVPFSLLHFDGADGGTTFTDEKGHVWTKSSATITTANKKFGSGAKSTAGYITSSTALSPAIGTGDFTIEGFFYTTSATSRGLFHTALVSSATGVALGHENVNGGEWQVYFGGTVYKIAGVPLILSTWQHFALVRYAGVVTLYLDGNEMLSFASSANITQTSLVYGAYYDGAFPFAGQMDECRAISGFAVYRKNFAPPSSPFPNTNPTVNTNEIQRVVSLLHFDGADGGTTFTDEKGIIWDGIGATIKTDQSKFGGSSLYLGGGSSSRVQTTNAVTDMDLLGGDFTVEGWVRPAAGNKRFFGASGGSIAWNDTTGIHFYVGIGGGDVVFVEMATGTSSPTGFGSTDKAPVGSWTYITVSWSRLDKKLYIGVNGNVQASGTLSTVKRPTKAPLAAWGKIPGGTDSGALQGHLDDCRVTKGAALYKTNFTPPTAPLPATI